MAAPTSNAFKKVVVGEALQIPAETYNAFIDAALAERARRGLSSATGDGALLTPAHARVSNDTGTDVPPFGCLILGDAGIDPTLDDSAPTEFERQMLFEGEEPDVGTLDDPFAVFPGGVRDGYTERGQVTGVAAVQLTVLNAGHEWAGPSSSSLLLETKADDSTARGAKILWKEAGTGLRWAYVLLPGLPAVSGGGTITVQEVTGLSTTPDVTLTGRSILRFDSQDGVSISAVGGDVARVDIATASTSNAGVVSTESQSFGGAKTFHGTVTIANDGGLFITDTGSNTAHPVNLIIVESVGGDSTINQLKFQRGGYLIATLQWNQAGNLSASTDVQFMLKGGTGFVDNGGSSLVRLNGSDGQSFTLQYKDHSGNNKSVTITGGIATSTPAP